MNTGRATRYSSRNTYFKRGRRPDGLAEQAK